MVDNAARFPYRQTRDISWYHERGLPGCCVIAPKGNGLAYIPIPKNACSSLKLFFYELREGHPFPGRWNGVHHNFGYQVINFPRFIEDTEHYKFAVVRDPIERFISGYNNRVKMFGELSAEWFDQHAPGMLPYFEENGLSFDPDVNDFAINLRYYLPLSWQIVHHFVPQMYHLHFAPDRLNGIYDVRDLKRLAADLSERLQRDVSFPRVQESGHVDNAVKISDLTTKAVASLALFYSQDYQALRHVI